MDPFAPKTLVLATTAATCLAWRAWRKQSLTRTGTAVGFTVGFLLVATGLRGLVLFYFYQIGSMATKYKAQRKATLDATCVTSSQRGGVQVLCVSLVAVCLSLWHAVYYGPEQAIDFTTAPAASRLTTAVLAHHAVSLGDTLASELGMVTAMNSATKTKTMPMQPVLVTQPWRRVPIGTNGGVTVAGTLWSGVGGMLIGALTVAMDAISGLAPLQFVQVTLYGGLCGLVGSFLDSLLGATLQVTYYDTETKLVYHHDPQTRSARRVCGNAILSNEQVNLVSVALTAYLGGWIIAPWFFGA